MTGEARKQISQRTVAERAFDRVLAFVIGAPVFASVLPPVGVPDRVLGLISLAIWLWLTWGVFATWKEPDARVLRYSSLILALAAASWVFSLFLHPHWPTGGPA